MSDISWSILLYPRGHTGKSRISYYLCASFNDSLCSTNVKYELALVDHDGLVRFEDSDKLHLAKGTREVRSPEIHYEQESVTKTFGGTLPVRRHVKDS
ncbi:hypothetical protein TNIN_362221 [Trichonephila inaurata madagascariensis]|uniref:Uncharacterized protein n=1 Tax=Trichonephila inaurata madagascariensis TaxID=2747483 RepID=A0A8X6K1L8_9ARAC|nr:hypothetical protein TNIN_362221 [Trichonephila inaurata madagascariensis]